MKSKSNNQKDRWLGVKHTNKIKIEKYAFQRKANDKSDGTIYGETTTLIKLGKYLKKDFRYTTQEDLQNFFSDKSIVNSPISSDLYATRIIQFFRFLSKGKLKRKERPLIMDWYGHKTTQYKNRNKDPDKKSKWLITRKEIDKIILSSPTIQDKALWETFYLTGARPDEILSMKIDSLKTLPNKGYEIHVYRSKTIPRSIPLQETPFHLLCWKEQHPKRNKKEAELWISQSPQTYYRPLTSVNSIEEKFRTALHRAGIKRHLTPKCFRKTRAYMIFNADKLNDSEIGLFFGWQPKEVPKRREDYDLTDQEDLRKKIFDKSTIPITLDKSKLEYDLKSKNFDKRIDDLENLILYLDHKHESLLDDYFHLQQHVNSLLNIKSKSKSYKIPDDFALTKISNKDYIEELLKESKKIRG